MRRTTLLATTALAALALPPAARAGDGLIFAEVPAPATDAAKREVLASDRVTVGGKDHPIAYRTLLRTGDMAGGGVFGLVTDEGGRPIARDGKAMIANSTDFSSLLSVGDRLYSVLHFEARPGAVYLTELRRDPATGDLSAVDTRPVDFSALGGVWNPCAGSVTPWGTHLGSEEYEPDARSVEAARSLADVDTSYKPMALYAGFDAGAPGATLEGFRRAFDPYRYGWTTEVRVGADGTAEAAKHYAMGRMSHELAYVMPDRKTVYETDDGTNVGLFMFVADEPGRLDSGRLYAMRWHQTGDENGGVADLDWVDLGHADGASVKVLIDKGTTFSDIFETARIGEEGGCPEGFRGSNANGVPECLKVKPGMELAASRLETRRYASMLGATTELRKEEGLTYDPDHGRLYVAISEIANGMEDAAAKGAATGRYEAGGANAIRVAYNPCGGVYALDLGKGEGSDYAAKTMRGMVLGRPTTYPKDDPYAGSTCAIDGLANPDNISYLPGHDLLLIGEDTEDGHQNDAVWAYDLGGRKLTRILTTPYGAETTSVYAYPNLGGHGYVVSVVQHPYGESDQDKLQTPEQAQAYLGYLGPFPPLD